MIRRGLNSISALLSSFALHSKEITDYCFSL